MDKRKQFMLLAAAAVSVAGLAFYSATRDAGRSPPAPPVAGQEQIAAPAQPPAALNLSPLCFVTNMETAADEPRTIDPALCDKGEIVAAQGGTYAPAAGFTGTAYRYGNDETSGPGESFVEYRLAGRTKDGRLAVLVRESGGGTGFFTSLLLLTARDDGKYDAQTIASGDRCNGGIGDVEVDEDGALTHSAALTAFALYALHNPADAPIEPLPDCAVCCYGKAHYRDGALEFVTLDEEIGSTAPSDPATLAADEKAAQCFDGLLRARIGEGRTRLAQTDIDDLARTYYQTCKPPAQ